MAFATTNARNALNLKMYAAQWTGSVGEASGTITLEGGIVYGIICQNFDGDNPKEHPSVQYSVSGSTITVTIHNHMGVTTGSIIIFYA